jgi:EAL domain-containing protein (putative c-di-GMP-specific phosphodiesterase class I)
MAFQPIVSLATGEIFAYEALARPSHPLLKGPLPLFSAAVAEGVCGELGRLLRRIAIEGCPEHTLFLNVHPDEFASGYLVRPDDALIVHEQEVYLEITESVPLTHYQHCHTVLAEIRAKGVKLAVDDLGAGYSNLKYIADLAPDIVKLDRELIREMNRSKRLMLLVGALVRLCEELGARVVGEGIETLEELVAAQALGVHYGQGYYLARPAFVPPPVSAPLWLR